MVSIVFGVRPKGHLGFLLDAQVSFQASKLFQNPSAVDEMPVPYPTSPLYSDYIIRLWDWQPRGPPLAFRSFPSTSLRNSCWTWWPMFPTLRCTRFWSPILGTAVRSEYLWSTWAPRFQISAAWLFLPDRDFQRRWLQLRFRYSWTISVVRHLHCSCSICIIALSIPWIDEPDFGSMLLYLLIEQLGICCWIQW